MDGECGFCVGIKVAVVGTQFGSGWSENIAIFIQNVMRHLEIIVLVDKDIVVEFFNLVGITL